MSSFKEIDIHGQKYKVKCLDGQEKRSVIHVRVGPMCSGKSSYLVEQLTRCDSLGYRTLYINSSVDTREEKDVGVISSHNNSLKGLSKGTISVKVQALSDLSLDAIIPFQVIGVDEIQFYPDLIETMKRWIKLPNRTFFLVGLDGTYEQKPFFNISELLSLSSTFKKIRAQCYICSKLRKNTITYLNAPFTNKINGRIDEGDVSIGDDQYISVCENCSVIS